MLTVIYEFDNYKNTQRTLKEIFFKKETTQNTVFVQRRGLSFHESSYLNQKSNNYSVKIQAKEKKRKYDDISIHWMLIKKQLSS